MINKKLIVECPVKYASDWEDIKNWCNINKIDAAMVDYYYDMDRSMYVSGWRIANHHDQLIFLLRWG